MSSSVVAPVVDGKLVQKTDKTETESSTTSKKTGGSLDKDAFLQLLVAEMKYQDPLEASNNSTEYISQLATFSELESMQNLQDTAEDMKMYQMIGKSVMLNVDDTLVAGQVDYLQYEDGKTKLSVNGSYYDLDDVYQVIDSDYLTATSKAQSIVSVMLTLPEVEEATKADLEAFKEAAEIYSGMTDYEKSFLTSEMIEAVDAYMEKYEAYTGADAEVDPVEIMIQRMDAYGLRLSDLLQQILDAQSSIAAGSGVSGETDSSGSADQETDSASGADSETDTVTAGSGDEAAGAAAADQIPQDNTSTADSQDTSADNEQTAG